MGTAQAKQALSNDPVETAADVELGKRAARVDKVFIDGVARTKNDILAKAVQDLMDCTNFEEVRLCYTFRTDLVPEKRNIRSLENIIRLIFAIHFYLWIS